MMTRRMQRIERKPLIKPIREDNLQAATLNQRFAPKFQKWCNTEAILNGTQAPHLSLDSMPGDISIDWNKQRAMLKQRLAVSSSIDRDKGVYEP